MAIGFLEFLERERNAQHWFKPALPKCGLVYRSHQLDVWSDIKDSGFAEFTGLWWDPVSRHEIIMRAALADEQGKHV